jgi:hypothetical protein
MKRVVLFFLLGYLSVIAFASFPVETQIMLTETDPKGFRLDTWGFIIGILSLILLPYSLLLLFIRKKNFRRSLAWGWLAGLVLIVLIVIFSFSVDEFKFLY